MGVVSAILFAKNSQWNASIDTKGNKVSIGGASNEVKVIIPKIGTEFNFFAKQGLGSRRVRIDCCFWSGYST